MRERLRWLLCAAVWMVPVAAMAQQPFTLQQILSAPYASELTAAPVGNLFAWVEDEEGRHNLWVGGPGQPARMLTQTTQDDGQDVRHLAWSPDAKAIAYTYGAESGADGKPANPAELQGPTALQVVVQPMAKGAAAITIGEGRNPIFLPLGHQLLFLRGGQIWSAELGVACRSEGGGCEPDVPQTSIHQLVFDRGSASSMTLSPDGRTLAYVSTRREVNAPSHRLLALFDLVGRTLTFAAPSTENDVSPAFSPDGKQLAWVRTPFTQVREFALDRVSANPWSIEVMDLRTRAVRTVFSPEAGRYGSALPKTASGQLPLLWAGASRLVFASEADGWLHLYAVDPGGAGQPVLLTPGDGEVEDPVVRGETLVFASNRVHVAPLVRGAKALVDAEDVDRRHVWKVDLGQGEPREQALTWGAGIEMHPAIAADGTVAALGSSGAAPLAAVMVGRGGGVERLGVGSRVEGVGAVLPRPVVFRSLPRGAMGSVKEGGRLLPQTIPHPAARGVRVEDGAPEVVAGLALHGQLFLPGGDADSSAALRNDKPKEWNDKPKEWNDKPKEWNDKPRNDKPKEWNDKYDGRSHDQNAGVPRVGVMKHPAILFFHGGPRRQMLLGYPGGEYYSNAYAMNQYLASRGFVVLSVNYRCGIGYGMEFRQCEHAGADGASEYADVLAAQRYLASRPDVDAKRIGVWGGSYGGYLTAMALARNSDLFAAGVDFHGVHDWNQEDNASDWKQGTFAEQDAIAARAFASSPMADVGRWRSPVLLIHGDNDAEVAYAETAVLAERLRAEKVPVEELIFPDEVHAFLLHRDWVRAYEAAAGFFERRLGR